MRWLRGQLRRRGTCRLAFWHRPRFSAGSAPGTSRTSPPLWNTLLRRASLVVSGHDHDMQRQAGRDGIVQLISGAGGDKQYPLDPDYPGLRFASDASPGALRLRLRPGQVRFAFVDVDGQVLDSGSRHCRRKR